MFYDLTTFLSDPFLTIVIFINVCIGMEKSTSGVSVVELMNDFVSRIFQHMRICKLHGNVTTVSQVMIFKVETLNICLSLIFRSPRLIFRRHAMVFMLFGISMILGSRDFFFIFFHV